MITLVAIVTILFFALALTRLDWALLLIIVALPTYLIRFQIFGLPLTLLEILILIAFAVWFFKFFIPTIGKLLKNKSTRLNYPYSVEIIILSIISLLAVGTAGWNNGALGIWKAYFFEPILFFLLLFNVFRDKKSWFKVLVSLAISATAVSVFAIFQGFTGLCIANPFWAASATRRVVSFFGYPNAVGLYLAPLVMIFSGWLASLNWQKGIFVHDRLKKIYLGFIILISILAIYLAKSEGALIGLAAGFIFLGLLSGTKSKIVTLILLVLIGTGIYFYTPARELVIEKITLSDLSGTIRQQQWKETLKMLKNSRLISGAGLDGYQTAVKPYHQDGLFYNSDNLPNFDDELSAGAELRQKYWQPVEIYLYPHNIFLNFWSELGLIGALLFAWIIGKYLFITLKLGLELSATKSSDKYLALSLFAAMLVIVIHGLVDVPYFKNDLALMFWIIIFLGTSLKLLSGNVNETINNTLAPSLKQ